MRRPTGWQKGGPSADSSDRNLFVALGRATSNRYWQKADFRSLDIESHSRLFARFDGKRSEEALSLDRSDLRLLIVIFTGHGELGAHLKRVGRIDNDECRFCKAGAESPLHILCECEALARMRLKNTSFGKAFPSPLDIGQTKLRKILDFFKRLGLEDV